MGKPLTDAGRLVSRVTHLGAESVLRQLYCPSRLKPLRTRLVSAIFVVKARNVSLVAINHIFFHLD